MASFTGIPELKESYRKLGPARFWSIMAATLAWIAMGVWLDSKTGWPEAYGFSCHGRGCLIDDLWHSPALLGHGGFALALFCWYWSMPAVVAVALLWRLTKTVRGKKLSIFAEPVAPGEDA